MSGAFAWMIFAAWYGTTIPPTPTVDATAEVRQSFERYDEGWRKFDATKVTDAFADQFEWVNEVGLRFTDKGKLTRFLKQVFANPDFRAGKPGPLVIRSIRLLAPDIAIVSSSEETAGQIDPAIGKALPTLRSNELTVMQHQGRRWLIVSDLASDEAHGI